MEARCKCGRAYNECNGRCADVHGTPHSSKRIETHCIDWACNRCKARARLPQLAGSTVEHVREAIERGHERRSFDCHLQHGIKHVQAIQDGKRFRFAWI